MPQEINKISFIIHPFFHKLGISGVNPSRETVAGAGADWLEIVNKASKDPNSLVVISDASVSGQGVSESQRFIERAAGILGNRLVILRGVNYYYPGGKRLVNSGKFGGLKESLKKAGFNINPHKLKTFGCGEFTLRCVFSETTRINWSLGMNDPVPYKNARTRILPKKSIWAPLIAGGKYPSPKERRELVELLRTNPERASSLLKKMVSGYIAARKERGERAIKQIGKRTKHKRIP